MYCTENTERPNMINLGLNFVLSSFRIQTFNIQELMLIVSLNISLKLRHYKNLPLHLRVWLILLSEIKKISCFNFVTS